MAYHEFKLGKVRQQFGLTINEEGDLFNQVGEVSVSEYLRTFLAEFVPLGLAVNTERARAEFLIAPLLGEARRLTGRRVSLFSGIEFNVVPEQGLNGYCDYIFSRAPEQLELLAPVLMLVEAKKEDIPGGLGQCIAEMIAAQIFNERAGNNLPTIYGAVTTGNIWKFMKLEEQAVWIDRAEYYVNQPGKILGILLHMLQDEQAAQALAA